MRGDVRVEAGLHRVGGGLHGHVAAEALGHAGQRIQALPVAGIAGANIPTAQAVVAERHRRRVDGSHLADVQELAAGDGRLEVAVGAADELERALDLAVGPDGTVYVVTGIGAPVMTEGRDDEEWRKRLTAKLRQIPSLVLIDNLRLDQWRVLEPIMGELFKVIGFSRGIAIDPIGFART